MTPYDDDGPTYERPTITVYPLKANKVPIGFAREWPKPPKKRKRASPTKARKK